MTVIPNTLNNGNVRRETPSAQATNYTPSFKAYEMEKDSFVPRPKESWASKNRDAIGGLFGVVAGEALWHSFLRKKAEGMKNMTSLQMFGLNILLDSVLAYIGGKIALHAGKDN